MGEMDRAADGCQNGGGLARRQRAIGQAFGERAAVDELHAEVGLAVGLTDFVKRNDVRMLKARDELGFGLKAGDIGRRSDRAAENHLEGDDAIETNLAGFVNHAHAAAAELFEQLVVAEDGGEILVQRGTRYLMRSVFSVCSFARLRDDRVRMRGDGVGDHDGAPELTEFGAEMRMRGDGSFEIRLAAGAKIGDEPVEEFGEEIVLGGVGHGVLGMQKLR